MRIIEAILFQPVGCLAEFQPEEFNEIAFRLFDRRKRAGRSGSLSYWHLLNVWERADKKLDESERNMVESLEVHAAPRDVCNRHRRGPEGGGGHRHQLHSNDE